MTRTISQLVEILQQRQQDFGNINVFFQDAEHGVGDMELKIVKVIQVDEYSKIVATVDDYESWKSGLARYTDLEPFRAEFLADWDEWNEIEEFRPDFYKQYTRETYAEKQLDGLRMFRNECWEKIGKYESSPFSLVLELK